ncbi:hypothetical protein ACU045_02820 [Microbacterium sp. MAHUQ-60]|uniref:hypothetical protein n=1 Tax=unclassified Microbacterium TaxID=2609290 RepID=UPI00361CAB08
MEWIAAPSAGNWLRERLDDGYATMHGVVPRGYAAYARVFHPASVRSRPEIPDDVAVTWADVASVFATRLHPLAQWRALVRTPDDEDWRTRNGPDGREFTSPEEGSMPPELLASVARHLVEHTGTPDAGFAALWAGWGGLLGFMGHSPSRSFFGFTDQPAHEQMLQRSIRSPFEDAFRRRTWQEGILSREISEGPRLQLPGREHVLFSAPPRVFADPDWTLDAPWRDTVAEEHGFPPSAQHPSLIWPDDRAWVVVSEIDFDSTIVAGSVDLVRAICADPAIEALPLAENADLTWRADPSTGSGTTG